MASDPQLVERIRRLLKSRRQIAEQTMFGGVAFFLRGHVCVGAWKDCLLARIGTATYDATLRLPHVMPFDITGRPMRGWILVSPAGIEIDEDLSHWIERAWSFTSTLPPKPKLPSRQKLPPKSKTK